MAQKHLIPKSKAKTAYGLLSEIRKLILEEPKRYDQTTWRYRLPNGAEDRPPCGTTACVAGWVVQLKVPRFTIWDSYLAHAARVLGLDDDQADALFDGDAAGSRAVQGCTKHAKRGEAHIARFQKKHANQLKRKRL